MTVDELLREARAVLGEPREGLPQPAREARWLLAVAWERSETWLIAHRSDPVPVDTERHFRAWLDRRAQGEPAHYIVGTCPFWGRQFEVSPAVLIPRPETELIVQRALELTLPPAPRALDVGTGSGCIAVTFALARTDARIVACDVSLEALAVARRNAHRHQAPVELSTGDLAAHLAGGFDLAFANLPYLTDDEVEDYIPEIREHEPRVALVGGPDGLGLIRRFVADLPRLLADGGHALLELGPGQADELAPEVARAGLEEADRVSDDWGCARVLVLRRR